MSDTTFTLSDDKQGTSTRISFKINGDMIINGSDDSNAHHKAYGCEEAWEYTIKEDSKIDLMNKLKQEIKNKNITIRYKKYLGDISLLHLKDFEIRQCEYILTNIDKQILIMLSKLFSEEKMAYRKIEKWLSEKNVTISDFKAYG